MIFILVFYDKIDDFLSYWDIVSLDLYIWTLHSLKLPIIIQLPLPNNGKCYITTQLPMDPIIINTANTIAAMAHPLNPLSTEHNPSDRTKSSRHRVQVLGLEHVKQLNINWLQSTQFWFISTNAVDMHVWQVVCVWHVRQYGGQRRHYPCDRNVVN